MSACVQKAVVFAAVLAPVDGLGVTAGVQLWVANVRVQLVDDRRAHVRQVQLADVIPVHGVVGLYAERAQYLGRRQTLQSHTTLTLYLGHSVHPVSKTHRRPHFDTILLRCLRNDLYCVDWDVKNLVYHTIIR